MKHYINSKATIDQALQGEEISMTDERDVIHLDAFSYKYGTVQPQKVLLLAEQGKILTDSVQIDDYKHENTDARFQQDHVQIHIYQKALCNITTD